MKNFLLVFLILCLLFTKNAFSQPAFIKDSLDNYIQQGLKDWQIPGLAIVIVKDGKIVVEKGYGVRDITTNEPVNPETLFMIASNTKLFTGTALAQLHYNKKLHLNTPIKNFFTNFSLYDSITTQLVTIKDMLTHRIGTKTFQGDFTFFNANLTRAETIYKMRYLQPTQLFRDAYGYCNSCYLTAGEIIPIVTGKPWEVYVYDSILEPLGMTQTLVLGRGISQIKNSSKAYTTSFSKQIQLIPYDNWDNLAPAASIVSNVKDLSKWLQMQLNNGSYNHKQIIHPQVINLTRELSIITSSKKSAILPTNFRGYGLGLYAADYNGKQIYWHTGGASGMLSSVCFVPEENLGIAILSNNDNQSFFEALRYQILDAYCNMPFINRSEQFLKSFSSSRNNELATLDSLYKRLRNQKPPLPLSEYCGIYHHYLYGNIEINQVDNKLNITFKGHDNLKATLQYLDNNEWLLTYNNVLYGVFSTKFLIENNSVKSITIKANDFIEYDAYEFTKKE